MDYDVGRAIAIQSAHLGIIKEFVLRYRARRPTVVMLPGGMGSQLDRSPAPFNDAPPDFTRYDPVWIDLGLIFNGDGLTLEIDAAERDRDGHIIVPNGELRFLIDSYDGTRQWAADRGFNYVVFGYDWRRPIEEGAGFLQFFLAALREAVMRKHGEDPLPSTTLLAHSQGGLVAQLFLHRVPNPLPWMRQLITVATPFYGTWSHMDRYFVGQSPLNEIHGRRRVASIVGTLPGPYALMYIDRATFDRDWQLLGFAAADDFPLRDASDASDGTPIDCYDPAHRARWPAWCSPAHLDRARQVRQTVARPLPAAVAARVHNIRSRLDATTPVRQIWAPLPDGFDPDTGAPSPVQTAATGGGDGTVPGWSAWHAHVPNRIECQQADSHLDMLEHVEVLNHVGALVEPGSAPVQAPDASGLYGRSGDRAARPAVEAFAADIGRGEVQRDDPRLYDERVWRGFMRELKR